MVDLTGRSTRGSPESCENAWKMPVFLGFHVYFQGCIQEGFKFFFNVQEKIPGKNRQLWFLRFIKVHLYLGK